MNEETKWLFIGGDSTSFPVVEQGGTFIGIPDRRFEWEAWDGITDAETNATADRIDGRDVAGIAQLTVDADGRIVVDRTSRPAGEKFCVVWTVDGRTRILYAPTVTEFGADDVQKRMALLPPRESEPIEQAQESASPTGMMDKLDLLLANSEAIKANTDTIPAVAEAVKDVHEQGAEVLSHAKSIPAFKQSLHDAMEKPYEFAAHLWKVTFHIEAEWMPLFKAMWECKGNQTQAAEMLSTPEKTVLQGTLNKQWRKHIKPVFAKLGGVDIDEVIAPRPDRKNLEQVDV